MCKAHLPAKINHPIYYDYKTLPASFMKTIRRLISPSLQELAVQIGDQLMAIA